MGTFFTGSLLEQHALTKEKFEAVVGLGSSKAEVRRIFCVAALRWAGRDTTGINVEKQCKGEKGVEIDTILDKWCMENFGLPYDSVFVLIQDITEKEFEETMLELGIRGNPSGIAIANEVIRKKENNGVVVVNFNNNVPLETEEGNE